MTTNPTEPESDNPTPSTWMSDSTIADLQAKQAELIQAAKKHDADVTAAREDVLEAERELSTYKDLAEAARKQIEENHLLLAIAQGRAPLPTREAIHTTHEGLGLALGALRIATVPNDATPEDLTNFAEVMRALYAAASGLASRADQAAKAAAVRGPRPSTPDAVNPDSSTTITLKRCCNGCGHELGDATEGEINASVEGRPLPDVRAECPTCNPPATEQPVTATGDQPRDILPGDPLAIPANRFPAGQPDTATGAGPLALDTLTDPPVQTDAAASATTVEGGEAK